MGFIISIIKFKLEILPDRRDELYIIDKNDAYYYINVVYIALGFIILFVSDFFNKTA
jgi:hypothetical protein